MRPAQLKHSHARRAVASPPTAPAEHIDVGGVSAASADSHWRRRRRANGFELGILCDVPASAPRFAPGPSDLTPCLLPAQVISLDDELFGLRRGNRWRDRARGSLARHASAPAPCARLTSSGLGRRLCPSRAQAVAVERLEVATVPSMRMAGGSGSEHGGACIHRPPANRLGFGRATHPGANPSMHVVPDIQWSEMLPSERGAYAVLDLTVWRLRVSEMSGSSGKKREFLPRREVCGCARIASTERAVRWRRSHR